MMKISAIALCLTILWTSVMPSAASTSYTVRTITDGDTITLEGGQRIRLLQIDTPEFSPPECFASEARNTLVKLIGKSKVTLEGDVTSGNKDSYGRLLRYVFINKTNVNLELVKLGAAAPYFYRGEKGKYATQLVNAAKSAQKNQIGLWKNCPGTKLDPNRGVSTNKIISKTTNSDTNQSGVNCDKNYSGCIPQYPPDLDCLEIKRLGLAPVKVVGRDVHKLDKNGDGTGCDG